MADLIQFSNPLLLVSAEQGIRELLRANETAAEYGLLLSAQDAQQIVEHRNEVLQSCARVEFSFSPLLRIAQALSASPFVSRTDYADTIHAFVELFYDAKNETLDSVGDEELIDRMVEEFNTSCQGSLELLESRSLFRLSQSARSRAYEYSFEEAEEPDEDEEEVED